MKRSTLYTFAIALVGLATNAYAHPGHSAHDGLLAGFLHPLSGVDHLLAMVAVGVWATQLGGRAIWAVPLAFVSMMALAAGLAMTGAVGIDANATESGIAASLLVLGLLVLRMQRLPVPAALALVGVFAWFHGAAHGSELPAFADPASYAFGFLAATALLHGLGLGVGAMASRRASWFGRIGGATTAIAGALLLAGVG